MSSRLAGLLQMPRFFLFALSEAARSLRRYGARFASGFAGIGAACEAGCGIQNFRSERVLEWFEPAGLVIEVAEIIIHEGDEPDFLAHLFDADLLSGEDGAEIDFPAIEADAPARGYGDDLVMERVIELGQAGIEPR